MDGVIGWVVIVGIFALFPIIRIFKRAGLNPALGLIALIPFIGLIATGIVLSLSEWKIKNTEENLR